MFEASKACDFEEAARLRDEIVSAKAKVTGTEEEDILADLKRCARKAPRRHGR